MKKIIVLGSTGSIGTQTLEVLKTQKEYTVEALTCGSNISVLQEQIKAHKPRTVVVAKEEDAQVIEKKNKGIRVLWGREGLKEVAEGPGDFLVNGLMGIKGLEPTLKAVESGKDVALANKETLVAGGQLVMESVKKNEVRLLPIDSEHSAIFQCLQGNNPKEVKRLILTASGGPFRNYAAEALEHVHVEQALKHPKWKMGEKITIDSATLMNKGLEIIEAKWLFDISMDNIHVVIHPQSIIHSMVEYVDGSVMAQMGNTDMKVPISYALSYPHRVENSSSLDLIKNAANLTFEKPDEDKFACLRLGYEVGRKGGSYPVVLNAVNEALVDLLLKKKIRFMEIPRILEKTLDFHKGTFDLTLEDILRIDQEYRDEIYQKYGGKQ